MKHAINKHKLGRSAGIDSMQDEHFKYAHSKVTGLLSMLFNAMFLHNYLPCKLTETIILLFLMRKKSMCFKPNSLICLVAPTVSFNDVPLTFVTSNKCLGVITHDIHQDDDDIMRYVKYAY